MRMQCRNCNPWCTRQCKTLVWCQHYGVGSTPVHVSYKEKWRKFSKWKSKVEPTNIRWSKPKNIPQTMTCTIWLSGIFREGTVFVANDGFAPPYGSLHTLWLSCPTLTLRFRSVISCRYPLINSCLTFVQRLSSLIDHWTQYFSDDPANVGGTKGTN